MIPRQRYKYSIILIIIIISSLRLLFSIKRYLISLSGSVILEIRDIICLLSNSIKNFEPSGLENVNIRLKLTSILKLISSFIWKSRIFMKYDQCIELLMKNVKLRMKELASVSIWAVASSMELCAYFGLIVWRKMNLFD